MSAVLRVTAGLAAAAVVGLVTAPAAVAAGEHVDVTNTETVQVYLSPDGHVETKRVYEQLSFAGTGKVELTNPVSTSGLRNLDGFAGFEVRDGAQVVETDVDGIDRMRTVSSYTAALPVTVKPRYVLDGRTIDAEDVVGRSGHLVATYTVVNRTSQPRSLTVDDGTGNTVTRNVEVPIPMVGSLTTALPAEFTRVQPHGASAAGDGKGGMKLSYTMTLFPPLGSETAELVYEADVHDAVLPQVDVNMLPIDPFANPTVKKASDSYQDGASTGADLVAGAGDIDSNLLKLRDGAGELMAGLVKLSAGADQLSAGLGDEAAPGSKRLADGAGALDAGLGRIDDGAGELRDGAGRLSDGAGRLADGTGAALTGSKSLRDGLGQISGGLRTLADRLPAAPDGVRRLIAGVDQIRAGLGDPATDGTLLNGLTRLAGGAAQLGGGLAQLRGDGSAGNPGLVAAKGGVDQVQAGLADATKAGGSLDQLIGGLSLVKSLCGLACGPVVDQLIAGANDSKTNLTGANLGLLRVSAGLGSAVAALDPQTGALAVGAARLEAGLQDALTGATKLAGGASQVREGLVTLKTSLTDAVTGVLRLSTGAGTAYDGSVDLADGLGDLDDGAGQLAGGAGRLADGAGVLSGGTGTARGGSARLAAGARDLAAGLADASDGSGLIAEGLRTAAQGAPRLVDGAGRLSKEGMGALTQAGTETAVDYGTRAARIKASSERAAEDGMAFGAPEGARGLTAYSFVLKGADGESTRNWTRGLVGAVLLGLGGLIAVRRRLG